MNHQRSRRRKERANVGKRLRGVYLRATELGEKECRIANVSELGIGVETENAHLPATGTLLNARLVVGHAAIPVTVKVIHATNPIMGMQFVAPSEELRSIIRSFFEPELAGASLRLVQSPPRVPGSDAVLRYSNDASDTLELVIYNNRIKAFRVGILGNTVEWSQGDDVALVQDDRRGELEDFLRAQLVKFVQNAEVIHPSHRRQLEAVLHGLSLDDI